MGSTSCRQYTTRANVLRLSESGQNEGMPFQSPRGTADVLPTESHAWQWLESEFREHGRVRGYREVRTPTFEDTELFARTAGETSDVVDKQMYSFDDKGGRNITLKPEGTAGLMRAVVQHQLVPQGMVGRFIYITPVFRYERPQRGRLREHHQLGAELVGSGSVDADVEVIELAMTFSARIGLTGLTARLNSLGRGQGRATYREALLQFAQPLLGDMNGEARAKAEKNPLRLLDSKDPTLIEALRDAPSILDYLEPEARERFERLQARLRERNVPFEVAPEIVRGLDYYTDTVFEIQSDLLGAQSTVCAGGRYDGLVAEIGGSPTPSIGFGMGQERTLLVLEALGKLPAAPGIDAFVVYADDAGRAQAAEVVDSLRAAGLSATMDLDERKVPAQMKLADRLGARYAILIGASELEDGAATVKELATGDQRKVGWADLASAVRP